LTNISRAPTSSQSANAARAVLELADENEAINRIPPPEGHQQPLYLHPVTGLINDQPLSRRQAAAQLANRRKNMLVFIASATLFAVFACWVSQSL
jgi:hypothetical protein